MNDISNLLGTKSIDYAEHKQVLINDAYYVYLEAGHGELIVFLHGFPDNAYSWEHQLKHFSEQGYRVVAPFLRGYAPTVTAENAYFDRATIANDIKALIETLNDGKPAFLVGQDWGAAVSYGILGAFPECVKRAAILAIPHPAEIRRTLKRSPKQVIRSFHWFLFQLPKLPELIIKLSRGRFLRFLWKLWSPDFADHQHVDHIVKTMLNGRGIENSLAYYRATLQEKYRDPELKSIYQTLDNPISVPVRVLCGDKDMRAEMLEEQRRLFTDEARYNWHIVENSGHFLHREQPDLVNKYILEWLRSN